MKKVSKIKRKLAIILIFLFSINTFATSMDNNDGSAFISKAEFDALKSSFQAQIDTYNNGIDSKIDEAIMSYLSGIKIATEETGNIIFRDWEDVACMHGAIAPSFQLPDTKIVAIIGSVCAESTSDGFNKNFGMSWKGTYKKPNAEMAIRPLVTGNDESGTQTANMVWNGIAVAYNEIYKIIRTWHHNGDSPHPGYLDQVDLYNFGGTLTDLTNIKLDGYYPGFDDESSTVIDPTTKWWWFPKSGTEADKTYRDLNYAGYEFGISNTSQTEIKEIGNTKKLYEHIIQWDKDTEWTVSNELFTKTFRKYAGNPYTSKNLLDAMTQDQKMAYAGLQISPGKSAWKANEGGTITPTNFQAGSYSGSMDIADAANAILPSIGMLKDDQKANKIYQYKDTVEFNFQNKDFTLPKETLEKGFPLLAAKKDTEIVWEPSFSYVQAYKDATTTEDNKNEIILKFSLGKYKNQDTIASSSTLIKVKDESGVKSDTIKTTSRKTKVTFTMPDDGIVYVKWWPEVSTTELFNMGWIATLDIKKSNRFIYKCKVD